VLQDPDWLGTACRLVSAVKWVVTFAGSRDHYQVPLALAEANILEALVTDFYAPLGGHIESVLRHLPAGLLSVLRRRYEPGLRPESVDYSLSALLADYLRKTPDAVRDRRLGRSAGSLAKQREAGLISYSYYGYHAFHHYGLDRWPKVLFQVHPQPLSVRRILEEELELSEFGRESLLTEAELQTHSPRLHELSEEPLLADECIVASNFTKRTLVENGVAEERVHVVPYGVDCGTFLSHRRKEGGPFRVIFVGQMVQRKGLEYLLKAWRRLRLPDAELVLAGRGRVDKALLASFASEFRYVGPLRNSELVALYGDSDLFCMPSLVEGFGLVYLEALACGLPVIATPNTGAADIVREGREGFIVPVRDTESLASCLEWAYTHREELREMRFAARKLAEKYSWSAFRKGVMETLDTIVKHGYTPAAPAH
jgi:glycosyltransferase involved in cell wall biosynthesis